MSLDVPNDFGFDPAWAALDAAFVEDEASRTRALRRANEIAEVPQGDRLPEDFNVTTDSNHPELTPDRIFQLQEEAAQKARAQKKAVKRP